jgi:invasion protein IalB
MKSSSLLTGLAFAAGLLSFSAGAMAQDPQSAATPVGSSAAPTAPPAPTDISNIGSWTVRCFPIASPTPCEMYQEQDTKETHQRVLGVTIAYAPGADRHLLLVAVPLGVAIPQGIVIQTDTFTSAALHYRSCDRAGCYVEMVIDNNSIEALAKSGPNAAIKIVADGGKAFPLHLVLDGFAAAHERMTALAKEKAKGPQQIDASKQAASAKP